MNKHDRMTCLRDRMRHILFDNILPFWQSYAPDRVNGGFYGRIRRDGTAITDAPKALVLNARILWTFSAVYRMSGDKTYLETADRAFEYIISHFIDSSSGFNGGYWLLNADGSVREAEGNMHTYGQGFLLYAFSEYAAATGKPEAYNYAGLMFDFIENHCRDGNKYREAPYRAGLLSMNTHLHIIEPVSNYFRICHDKRVLSSLVNLTEVFLDTIYNAGTHHQNMFFSSDGTPYSSKISYGHDIEFSWLITEAAEVLREYAPALYDRCLKCASEIAGSVYREGIDASCGALFDEGMPDGKILHPGKIWWVQAEEVVGFFNAWQISGDERYLDAACGVTDYIGQYIIDSEYGEWYRSGIDSSPNAQNGNKADEWKCPYHNSRMAIEIISRVNRCIK